MPLLPFEYQGGGWNDAYYFIRPISSFIARDSSSSSSSSLLESVSMQSEAGQNGFASVLVADTLQSGFDDFRYQCLPVRSQCYLLQLSFAREYLADDAIEFPQIFFPDEKVIHRSAGKKPLDFVDDPISLLDLTCPFQVNISFPIAKICIADEADRDNSYVTFFSKIGYNATNYADFGQLPETVADLQNMQSLESLIPVGSCTLNVSFVRVAAPSSQPVFRPSLSPTTFFHPSNKPQTVNPTAAPSVHPTYENQYYYSENWEYGSDSAVDFGRTNFSCFERCPGFPRDGSFSSSLHSACSFLTRLFGDCNSYSVAKGLCPPRPCAKACSPEVLCYFGAGRATSCPSVRWGANNTVGREISAMCVASILSANNPTTSQPSSSTSDGKKSASFQSAVIGNYDIMFSN